VLFIEIALGVILGIWFLSAVCATLIRIGIKEYFKQKRIYILDMLKHGIPEEQEK